MRRRLNHTAMAAVGFVEPWSVQAGDRAEVFVSTLDPDAGVRIVSLDRDVEEAQDWVVQRSGKGFETREYDLGSWIGVPEIASPRGRPWRLVFEFLLTRNEERKCVCSIGGLAVLVDADGSLRIADGDERRPLASLDNERWYRLSVAASESSTRFQVTQADGEVVGHLDLETRPAGRVAIGSGEFLRGRSLNGRIGRIAIETDGTAYRWRFPVVGPATSLAALGAAEAALSIHNMPTFAAASLRFTGEIHDPRLDAAHFDAIHLHDDDFGGFDWPVDLRVIVPPDARSGVFAVEIGTANGVEKLPFFVRPKTAKASLAFLVPTSTYLAYSDERLPPTRYPWHGTDRGHRFAVDNGFLCLYDVHSDLSGVSLTSARRPRATLRDDYHYPLSGCEHLLPVDLRLLKFYARNGIEIDVVTDRDLHDLGVGSISAYGSILTGSHPEYWSTPMMRALDAYLDGGGNLAYLGGNGFYWVVAYQGQTMELRRVKSDIWSGRPGEAHMSVTGEPGGNWEDRGLRNPQAFLGVTYLIMSFGPARPYRRLEGSYGEEYSWLFEGVSDEPIGAAGSVLGGAAGYEIDAVVRSGQTPRNLVRLATADGFDDSFQVRPDVWLADGEAERQTLRRADMTIYRHKGGGLVFCTGSVAWIGALPGPEDRNGVGRIMMNLAKGFTA